MSCKTDPNDERKFKVKLQKIQNDWTKEWSASTKKDTQEYKYNDKVLIRMGNSGKRSHPKRRFVEEGIILKKGKHSDNYKVLLIPPVKLISLNSGSLSKILHQLNTQIKLILVGNHTEVST